MYSIVAVLLWGLVQIPIKMAKAPGRVGVMISMPAGLVVITLILILQGNLVLPEATGGDWFLIVVCGIATFPAATFAYFEAVQRAGITTAAPITRLTPVLVVLVAAALPGGRLLWPSVLAAAMIFVGGVLLAHGAHRTHPIETRRDLRIGLMYAFFACLMWVVSFLGVDHISGSVPRSLVVFYGLGIGAIVHWAVMWLIGRAREVRNVTRRDVVCYCLQGVGSFALGYWAMFESIELLGVGRSAVITGTWPVPAAIVGFLVFREAINVQKSVGIVLLILSAVLAGIGPWLEGFLLTLF